MEKILKKLQTLEDDINTLVLNYSQTSGGDNSALQTQLQGLIKQVENMETNLESFEQTTATKTETLQILEKINQIIKQIDALNTSLSTHDQTIQTKVDSLGEKIDSLTKKVDSTQTPTDDNYTGKTFSEYPAGTIMQTYDCYEQKLAINSTSSITSPKMYFCALEGCSATLKLHSTFKDTKIVSSVLCQFYLNDSVIHSQIVEMSNTDTEYSFSTTLYGVCLNQSSQANNAYIKLSPNTTNYSRNFVLTNIKLEVIAPNAQFLNKPMPFNVEAINDKYYFSDCTSGTALTAEILATDMHNMDNLSWQDTQIECSSYQHIAGFTQYDSTYLLDIMGYFYVDGQNYRRIKFPSKNFSAIENLAYSLDWCPVTDTTPHMTCLWTNKPKMMIIANADFSRNMTSSYSGKCSVQPVKMIGFRAFDSTYSSKMGLYFNITINEDGTATLRAEYTELNYKFFELGNFTDATLYACKIADSLWEYNVVCYLKYFDRIIKKQLTFSTRTRAFTLLSTEEVGYYDKFFLLPNNDYVVLKNNKLEYHLFESTENTENAEQNE